MDMQNIRHFYLESDTESIDLNGSPYLFQNASGIGLETEYEYIRIGSAYVRTKNTMAQSSVSGEIVIRGRSREEIYKNCKAFTDFMQRNRDGLRLSYKAPGIDKRYYMDVDVSSFSKSELGIFSMAMVCDIVFAQRSRWYLLNTEEYSAPSVISKSKYYDYTYNYTYFDVNISSIEYTAGVGNCPCILRIYGPCTNPRWMIVHDNEDYMSGAWNGTLADGDILTINSIDGQQEAVYHSAASGTDTDTYQNLDFDRENFVVFPYGSSTMAVTQENDADVEYSLQVREEYDAV